MLTNVQIEAMKTADAYLTNAGLPSYGTVLLYLHMAVARVSIANEEEGQNMLSAWFPDADAVVRQALGE